MYCIGREIRMLTIQKTTFNHDNHERKANQKKLHHRNTNN